MQTQAQTNSNEGKVRAYCHADGVIRIQDATDALPSGALPIAVDERETLEPILSALARRAYDNKTLLVPGIPEADDQDQGLDALLVFNSLVRARLKSADAA